MHPVLVLCLFVAMPLVKLHHFFISTLSFSDEHPLARCVLLH